MPTLPGPLAIHATAVVLRDSGILIRGRSGAGKSSLALALLDRASGAGWFARLLGDDRVIVEAAHGRVLAQPHPSIEGRIERRGSGILPMLFQRWAVLRIVVDLEDMAVCDKAPRLPEPEHLVTRLCGIELPRIVAPSASLTSGTVAEIMRVLLAHERRE